MEVWTGRRIFRDGKAGRPAVDVFFDKLDFCHAIDFRKRLEVDYPTISLADLVLEKLQIVEINEKDLKDMIVVLLEHAIGDSDAPETINGAYISTLLSEDWGFFHTLTTNLNKVDQFTDSYEALVPEQRTDVHGKVATLRQLVESRPKSFGWKVRARVGTSRKWYKDVAEERRL
jgi:hypothetical protein